MEEQGSTSTRGSECEAVGAVQHSDRDVAEQATLFYEPVIPLPSAEIAARLTVGARSSSERLSAYAQDLRRRPGFIEPFGRESVSVLSSGWHGRHKYWELAVGTLSGRAVLVPEGSVTSRHLDQRLTGYELGQFLDLDDAAAVLAAPLSERRINWMLTQSFRYAARSLRQGNDDVGQSLVATTRREMLADPMRRGPLVPLHITINLHRNVGPTQPCDAWWIPGTGEVVFVALGGNEHPMQSLQLLPLRVRRWSSIELNVIPGAPYRQDHPRALTWMARALERAQLGEATQFPPETKLMGDGDEHIGMGWQIEEAAQPAALIWNQKDATLAIAVADAGSNALVIGHFSSRSALDGALGRWAFKSAEGVQPAGPMLTHLMRSAALDLRGLPAGWRSPTPLAIGSRRRAAGS